MPTWTLTDPRGIETEIPETAEWQNFLARLTLAAHRLRDEPAQDEAPPLQLPDGRTGQQASIWDAVAG